MKRLLVTNDDGIDSPALLPLLRALAPLAQLCVVVPDRERSWIGKAITRFEPIRIEPRRVGEFDVVACSGTPADCANLGIHRICDAPPDQVVSGINVGLNHGDAFAFSSGTVGAAAEAHYAGVPAAAFSMGPAQPDPAFHRRARLAEANAAWEAAAAICADVVGVLLEQRASHDVDLINVNVPEGATPATPRRITQVAELSYGALFHPHEDEGLHRAHLTGLHPRAGSALAGSDHEALRAGEVSITPLALIRSPAMGSELAEALRAGPAHQGR